MSIDYFYDHIRSWYSSVPGRLMTLTNIFVVGTAVVQVLYSTGTWLYIKKVRNELVFTFPDMGTWHSIIRC